MKILTGIDIPFLPSSGSPIICNDWYSNLPEDVRVRFLALNPDHQSEQWWSINDVILMKIEKKKSAVEFPAYVGHLKKEIIKQIQFFQPDIIHCQHLNYGFSRAVAELDYPIPKIGICHGTDVQLATLSDFFLNNMKFIAEKMDLLLFPTQNMKNDYIKHHAIETESVVIPHGIPDEAYKNGKNEIIYDWSNKYMKVLYAGRLNPFKGVDIVVSSMHYIPEDISLTIIGNEDSPGYMEKILTKVKEDQIQERVQFINHMSRHDLWKQFSEFDLIVFPSTELECFSLTTIEAQARGLVVAYHENAGGIENTVGSSGIRIYENNPEVWAETLRLIYHNPDLLYQYRRLGFKNAEKYRLSNIKDNFFNLSRTLVSNKSLKSKARKTL